MIGSCRRCHRPYWRYRADHPPAGYCSNGCHELRGEKFSALRLTPQQVLADWRAHLREAHPGASITDWLDCDRCDELQLLYATALGEAT